MIAFGGMFPPTLVFIGGGGQFAVEDGFDLFKAKDHNTLALRECPQVFFEWGVFSRPFFRGGGIFRLLRVVNFFFSEGAFYRFNGCASIQL